AMVIPVVSIPVPPVNEPLLALNRFASVELLPPDSQAPEPIVDEPVLLFPQHWPTQQRRIPLLALVPASPEVLHRLVVLCEVQTDQVHHRVGDLPVYHEGHQILEGWAWVRRKELLELPGDVEEGVEGPILKV